MVLNIWSYGFYVFGRPFSILCPLIRLIQVYCSKLSINETQVMEQHMFSFGIKEQLMMMLQNVNDVSKRAHLP